MTLKNITRQNLEPCYYIHVTKIKKVRIATMTDAQKKELIEKSGQYLKDGLPISMCKTESIKKMMSEIAANVVLIDLCDLNHLIVSNICDGDFLSIQPHIEEITERLATCLAIMKAKGDNLNEAVSNEQIDFAIQYTVYEQIEGRDIK